MPNGAKVSSLAARGVQRPVEPDLELIDRGFAELIQANPRAGASIDLTAERSVEADEHQIPCSPDDVVELTLEDDLRIYTSVERLRDEVIPADQARGARAGELVVPRRIRFPNRQSRGVDDVLVAAVELLDLKGKILDKLAETTGKGAAKVIAGWLEDKLVGDGGLFTIEQIRAAEKDASGAAPKPVDKGKIDTSQPLLLFIHGTASRTHGSFSDLWSGGSDDIWSGLTETYRDNIVGFEHRTLTASPIKNALDLVKSLPKGARLHLVSHSRGGLVGELLCRGQFSDGREPFTPEDLQLFAPKGNNYLKRVIALGADKADYEQHLADLTELNAALKAADLKVERFVRVACPARGTTLASGKLDLYLSAILNIIGMIPPLRASGVYGFVKAFVIAVARQRTRPEELPGLEAQMPGSPFIAMLNGARETTAAHLAVIAGDIEPTGIFKKLALFLVDRFYESDHDLVVNTPSMDGGATRSRPIPVLPRQGEDVHHFSYFSRGPSRRGLAAALQTADLPPGFELRQPKPVVIARSLPRDRKPGEVPVVFLLPGISGSHIGLDGNRIWVDVFDLIRGRFPDLEIGADGVKEDGLIARAYGDLADFLAKSHEVIPFPYDWRRSILEASDELAGAIDEQLRKTDQPVRIVAHSMGGLVARGMMAKHRTVWGRMREREGSRVLMLGTPNSGSYSIPRLFAIQDKLIKWLAFADLRHDVYELLDVMRHFPGVLELLPVTGDDGFFTARVWDQFSAGLGGKWRKPPQPALRAARRTWDTLQQAVLDAARVFYIAGHADETPIDVRIDDGRIRFLATGDGDGRVPWEGGIPQGIKHWFVDAVHGDLADHEPAFEGMLEILERGDTRLLATQPPVARGVAAPREMLEDSVEVQPSGDMLEAAALGSSPYGRRPREAKVPPVNISVCHGNLRFATAPIMVSHYKNDTIVSAEAALDRQLDGRLQELYRLGLYPGPLMTNEVLLNEYGDGGFPGAIVVGLGEVGELTAGGLTDTYRDALLRFAVTVRDRDAFQGKPIRAASLLIGTGSGGLPLDDAIAAMLRAVVQANRLLAGPTVNVDRTIDSLQFIELFEDTAVRAQRRLNEIAQNPEFANRVEVEAVVQRGDGGLTRVSYKEDEAWWQRLRIESTRDHGLKFTALTKRARAEMRTQPTQRQSVEPFLKTATADTSSDTEAGRVLFELLIPHDFKNYAQDGRDLVLVLDDDSAVYPWELLQYGGRRGNQALSLQAGMIRQLATSEYARPNLCMNGRALVVGDPRSDFAELPGALVEAHLVADLLGERFGHVELLPNPTGAQILSRLMTQEYQVLHLAGHGVFDHELPVDPAEQKDCSDERKPKRISGMVIGPNHFLTPIEIRQMPATPELVFINCCHLGMTKDNRPAYPDRPHRLAANLATQLIRQGVRAVIAAGWAVDDRAAQTFAQRFYDSMLSGETFGGAVFRARKETCEKHPGINTWGAYQCYGDQGYRLEMRGSGGGGGRIQPRVSLAEYLADIRNIAEDAKTADEKAVAWLRRRLDDIVKALPGNWSADGEFQTALGQARGELDQFEQGIAAYGLAIGAEDGRATIRAAEQRANLQARLAVERAVAAVALRNDGRKGDANRLFSDARKLVTDAAKSLQALCAGFGETVERLALLGSTCKRGALVRAYTEDDEAKARKQILSELKQMGEFYERSCRQALEARGTTYAYPLLNWLTALWLSHELDSRRKLPAEFDEYLRDAVVASPAPELNREFFWNVIAQTDCHLLKALYDGAFADRWPEIRDQYKKVRKIAASPRQFRSVIEHLEFLREVLRHGKVQTIAKDIERLVTELRPN